MTAPQTDRLALARWEADRRAAVLGDALARWRALPTPGLEAIESDPALRQLTDQILFRFMKLQDAMGERLIPGTLGSLMEPFESWPMRDKLDRLEKLGFLDVEAWLRWRNFETAWSTSIRMHPTCATPSCWRPLPVPPTCSQPTALRNFTFKT